SEYVAGLGFETVAFDVSPAAIRTTRGRYPDSGVEYAVANVFDLPDEWGSAFDLVVEVLTVQSLPTDVRGAATDAITRLVAPDGILLVIAAARTEDEPSDGPPWPLTRADVDRFATARLVTVGVEDLAVPDNPPAHRWRAEFRAGSRA
ncbi:MAG: class I SAM-dependent methyltransferase, partial [Nocardioidaceae bacterium]